MISNWCDRQNAAQAQQPWSAKTIIAGVLAYAFFSSQLATFQHISSQPIVALSPQGSDVPQLRERTELGQAPLAGAAPDLGRQLPGMENPSRPSRPARAEKTSTPSSQLTQASDAIDRDISGNSERRAVNRERNHSNRHDDSGTNWSSIVSTLFSLGLILYVRRRMSQYAAKQTSKGFSWLGEQLAGLAKRATAAQSQQGTSVPVKAAAPTKATSAHYPAPATVSGTRAPKPTSSVTPRKSVVSRR